MEHLSTYSRKAEIRVRDVVQSESRMLYTQNKSLLATLRAKYLTSYREALSGELKDVPPPTPQPG